MALFRWIGNLEPHVSTGTDTHQSQEGCAEIWHCYALIHRDCEDKSQNNGPGSHLEAVKAHTCFVAENIIEKAI
jgi:hypothetical protein